MTQTETHQSYLTFWIGDELFATNVSKVLEILEVPKITKVPRSPDFMRGVINLRGAVLPVIDTRIKFGLPITPDTVNTCIVVLTLEMEGHELMIGAIADSVKEVIEVTEQDILDPPSVGSNYKAEFVEGMLKLNEQFIMLLDIDKVFASNEVIEMKELTSADS